MTMNAGLHLIQGQNSMVYSSGSQMGISYDLSESVKSYLAVTKVFGDKSQSEDYTFNHMEEFSHIRLELKYYY